MASRCVLVLTPQRVAIIAMLAAAVAGKSGMNVHCHESLQVFL